MSEEKGPSCGLTLITGIVVPIIIYFVLIGPLENFFRGMVTRALTEGDIATAFLATWLDPLHPVVAIGVPLVAIVHILFASIGYPDTLEETSGQMIKEIFKQVFVFWWGAATVMATIVALPLIFFPILLGFLSLIMMGGLAVSLVSTLVILVMMSIIGVHDVRKRNASIPRIENLPDWSGFSLDPSYDWKLDESRVDRGWGGFRASAPWSGNYVSFAFRWYSDAAAADLTYNHQLKKWKYKPNTTTSELQNMELNGHSVEYMDVVETGEEKGVTYYLAVTLMRFDCSETGRFIYGAVVATTPDYDKAIELRDKLKHAFSCH